MSQEHREVTTRGWGERIGRSVSGAVFGIFLFLGALGMLWWNEGRSVDRIATLESGRDQVVSVDADRADPALDGALIHLAGMALTRQTLQDPVFAVQAQALRLNRVVEMYQWQEASETKTVKQLGGSEREETVFTYRKLWSESAIDSSAFKLSSEHRNPGMPFESATYQASDIAVGAFRLATPFRDQLGGDSEFPLSDATHATPDPSLPAAFRRIGSAYVKGDPGDPQVGDMRVRFTWIPPTEVSAIGRQTGSTVTPYSTRTGTIALLGMGIHDAGAMFAAAEDENALLTWILRAAGVIGIGVGFALLLLPLARLGDVVPILGNLLGGGIAMVATLVALALGAVTIALAWIAYRPVLAVAMLVLTAVAIGGFVVLRRRKTTAPAA